MEGTPRPPSRRRPEGLHARYAELRIECQRCWARNGSRQLLARVARSSRPGVDIVAIVQGPKEPRAVGRVTTAEGRDKLIGFCPVCMDLDGPTAARVTRNWAKVVAVLADLDQVENERSVLRV